MKLLLINSVLAFGSTGRIVLDIAKEYEKDGYEVKIAYGQKRKVSKAIEEDVKKYGVRIGSDMDVYSHVLYTRLTDKHGLASKRATKAFLKWAEGYNPDILWLHNIHGYYINYELLFQWIKSRPKMLVKWTLHDCWAFTGHCSHFTYVKCDKWKNGCHSCPQLDQYPRSISDNSKDNYNRKKAAFTGVSKMTLITPSNWLKEKVKGSFLSEYPVEVKYNTIDTNVFKPTPSTFKEDHGIQDKKMILGVANIWNDRKGLKDFIELSKLLDTRSTSAQNDNKLEQLVQYQIVLVGLNDNQLKELKEKNINILGLPRTSSAEELARVYTAADVFVNPTYEDTFPTVNMEAEACGTTVITYDTGGCKETISLNHSKIVNQSIVEMADTIVDICNIDKRDKQFETFDGLFTWYDAIINIYEASFWVHYQILNQDIEIWGESVKLNKDIARVMYFVNTEYMSMVYSELLLTLEVLFKAELMKAGVSKQDLINSRLYGHKLVKLIDGMQHINNERCLQISNLFIPFMKTFEITDNDGYFINTRYIDWENVILDENSSNIIKRIVSVLDIVYEKYYSEFNLERLLYLGMEASMGECELSDDEKRRLSNLGIIE